VRCYLKFEKNVREALEKFSKIKKNSTKGVVRVDKKESSNNTIIEGKENGKFALYKDYTINSKLKRL
jgi:hypothetical protein